MNGYEKRTKIKRDSIIAAAWELFSKRGITDVTIIEIAAKANVSQVSIYNYFGDKNSLAKEAFASYLDNVINDYDDLLEMEIPFSDKLKLVIEKEYEVTAQISRSVVSECAWADKALQQVFKEAVTSKAISVYKKFIDLGKKAGAIDRSIPNDAILTFILSAFSIIEQPIFLKASPDYKAGVLNLFFYGLLGTCSDTLSLGSQ